MRRTMLVYWGKRGGGSLLILRVATRLAEELGPANVVMSMRTTNDDIEEASRLGVPLLQVEIPSMRDFVLRLPHVIRTLNEQAAAIERAAPDLVVFMMNFPLAWPFIAFLQRRKLRVAFVAHDANPHPGDYATLWQRVTQRLILARADSIIATSDFVRRQLTQQLRRRAVPVRLVPLEGMYSDRSHGVARQPVEARPVRLLFFGRLLRYKGLDTLARALEPLRTRTDWSLTVAGHGPVADEVRSMFDGWPQVELKIGWQSQADFEHLISAHDVLLCPYVEASQSGVIAEALTFGMPSLVMPSGALPEQVGHGRAGLVADTGDASGFRAIVAEILDHPARLKQLSEGALATFAERRPADLWRAMSGEQA